MPFAALVIGRTVPDLCLLQPFRVDGLYRHAHSLHGPVTVNLAAGWAAYLLWRLLLDRPLRDLLPAPWHRRVALPATMRVTVAGAGAVIAGIAIEQAWPGACTTSPPAGVQRPPQKSWSMPLVGNWPGIAPPAESFRDGQHAAGRPETRPYFNCDAVKHAPVVSRSQPHAGPQRA